MKYRGRTEIVATILEAAKGGVTKTKIMYVVFSKLQPIKGIPFCFERKQSNRI